GLYNMALTMQLKTNQKDMDVRMSMPTQSQATQPDAPINKNSYIFRPLADTKIVDPRHIKNILVFAPEEGLVGPKLGEAIINAWPLMVSLAEQYPQARIYVATDFPDIYFSEHFQGKVTPVPTEYIWRLQAEGDNRWGKYDLAEWENYTVETMKNPLIALEFIKEKKIDLVFDLYQNVTSRRLGSVFDNIKSEMFEGGKLPYLIKLFPVTKLFSGTRKNSLSTATGKMAEPLFTDRDGKTYIVSGTEEAVSDITKNGLVDDASIWRFSILLCHNIGLNVDVSSLGVLEPTLKERNAALTILKRWHDKASDGTTPFDPLKKVFIINVYGVSHPDIISKRAWATIISRLLKETDAYLVFTHGGKMDQDVNMIDAILNMVDNHNPNRILLPRQELYPAITSIISIADWVLTPDTGLSHLASGVYDKPTSILTTHDITHWLPSRKNSAKPIFVDSPQNVMGKANIEYALREGGFGNKDALLAAESLLYVDVIEEVLATAREIDKKPMKPAVLKGRLSALSITGRARLEKEAIEDARKKGLSFPDAERDLRNYVGAYLDALGYGHEILPRIVFVDMASQMAGDSFPHFKVKLHWGEPETMLLVDKSALVLNDDGVWSVREDIKKFEILHEVLGHMFLRARFPEFEEASRSALRSGHESEQLLMTKTEEEILARIMTFLSYEKAKERFPHLKNDLMEKKINELGLNVSVLDVPLFLAVVVKTILATVDDLNIYKYKQVLSNPALAKQITDKVAAKLKVLLRTNASDDTAQVPADSSATTEKDLDAATIDAGLGGEELAQSLIRLLETVRAPAEKRVFFIPSKSDNLAPRHTARADILYALRKEGFSNVKIIFYDGTERGLNEAVVRESGRPNGDLDDPATLALAYVDANMISKDAVIEHNKTHARFKWLSEDMPTGDVPVEEIFMHVMFGLPVLDYVKNSADPDHRARLMDIIEKMVDNGRKDLDLLKADFNNLFVSGIILTLKKITRIDINAEMHRRDRTLKEVLTAA
ncbi:MAG: hypothetical protein NC933_05645, partial [Candidatus Omnitrophica bacterium]|nr:hypothetical protein [Candidatus Omnitrophota bacterium]